MFEYECDSGHIILADCKLDHCVKVGVDQDGKLVVCCSPVTRTG
jgi:hypothetical protein